MFMEKENKMLTLVENDFKLHADFKLYEFSMNFLKCMCTYTHIHVFLLVNHDKPVHKTEIQTVALFP